MKVVLLSKQLTDGEAISEYVKTLAEHLVDNGHEAAIVSFDDGSYYSVRDEVNVYRVPLNFDGSNIYNWSMMMNNELKREARRVLEDEQYDIIHANDWTTIPGGVAMKKHTEKPLITTIHSTENERGFQGDQAEMISELEWQGCYESDFILTTKEDTKNSALFDLDTPNDKIEVIDPYTQDWEKRVLKRYEELVKNKEKQTTSR